ncbi:Phosphomevalonate kinase [Tribonema minus]|uniref:phosphomevalonate kinase n=1 Tax=Tribonema minus TaxID=303371 RepID=A0A835YYC0_9STRA|nr:Phosphomevalonate kinase [Tribonema minus]
MCAVCLWVLDRTRRCVSAPGKVLLTGGYLVLEQPNSGIVLGTTARFHTTTCWERYAPLCLLLQQTSSHTQNLAITVDSPQFRQQYYYTCSFPPAGVLPVLSPKTGQPSNVYVECTLKYVMAFLATEMAEQQLSGVLHIKLEADNDFYSQTAQLQARGLPVTAEALASLPTFLPCPTVDGHLQVSKTGMGSSAAMITSLVGALLVTFHAVELPSADTPTICDASGNVVEGMRIVHNLAQACHAAAQGKIGSGFDVAAAVYGTHVYTRFSPTVLADVLSATDGEEGVGDRLRFAVVATQWDLKREPIHLPQGFCLLMGDVQGGSSTPSMVKSVLKWRAAESTKDSSADLWGKLAQVNNSIRELLQELSGLDGSGSSSSNSLSAAATYQHLSLLPSHQRGSVSSTASSSLCKLRDAFVQMRALLREMGDAAGVPIEPPEQTALANATAALPGVLCSGVPGAGGVDAIYAIVVHPSAASAVQDLWASWQTVSSTGTTDAQRPAVCPLLLRATGAALGDGIVCKVLDHLNKSTISDHVDSETQ